VRLATKRDVEAAYELLLHRVPESEKVYTSWVDARPVAKLVSEILRSKEYLALHNRIEPL
jgi:hypothetical protein